MDKNLNTVELELTPEDAAAMAEQSLESSLAKVRGLAAGDDEAIAQFEAQVQEAMAEAEKRADPRSQRYFRRMDTGSVVKSQEEYERCTKRGVPMGLMSYNQAVASVRQELHAEKQLEIRKRKRKVAKESRRRNRKR